MTVGVGSLHRGSEDPRPLRKSSPSPSSHQLPIAAEVGYDTSPPSQPPNPRHQGQGFVSLFLCGFGSCSHSCCEVKCVITLSCLANIIWLHVSPATGYYNLGTPPLLCYDFRASAYALDDSFRAQHSTASSCHHADLIWASVVPYNLLQTQVSLIGAER